ncbi:hypothetical protein [uncultured Duncaniella sp.]|uniref:hypothetical protein n=1 Tax=uncultured Duncaniella sp. TaxID=2768039 RepID=UPI0025B6AC48|nr:hypothetical protein [uncultured Duncaniella sp.]
MATKDDYYKKLLTSLQEEIEAIKSVQQAISKRIDALESRPAPSKFNTSKFREEVNEWECDYLERIRTNVSEVCTLIFDEATPNMIIKPQFDKFQEDMKIRLTDIEKRIIIAEENAGNRISLFTLSRPTYITERYNNPDRHPDPTPSFLEKYKKEIALIVSIAILFITISLFAIATENKTLKQDNAALRNALEQIY